jgi:hypothetical protein
MANEERLLTISKQASADLSASQYCFMKISSGQLALPAAHGADAIGVLQDKPNAAGIAGELAIGGVSKVIAGGTFSAGAAITCDASGHAIAAATGYTILGKAMSDGASGLMSSVLLDNGGVSA